MPSKTAYVAAIRKVESRFTRMEEATIKQTAAYIAEVRKSIAAELTAVDGWNARRLQELDVSLQRHVAELDRQLRTLARPAVDQSAIDGADYTVVPLATIDINIPNIGPTLPQLIVIQDYIAGLITAVTDETIQRISSQVKLAALGNLSPFEAMKQINKVLGIKSGREIVGGIGARSEKILRTELNRVFSIANHSQQQATAQQYPEIQKRWLSTGDTRTRRSHLYAHGQTQPIDEPFTVGGAALMYPLDPAGPAKETINCRCRSTTIHPSIGVIDTPLEQKIEKEKRRRRER